MEYIYYCAECKKFFYQVLSEPVKVRRCVHCSSGMTIYCEKNKEEYDLLTDVEKEKFKQEIKLIYQNTNDIRKVLNERYALLKKKKEEKIASIIVTTGDIKE